MKTKLLIQIGLVLFIFCYLRIVIFTYYSLTGFWTDIIFIILLFALGFKIILKDKSEKYYLGLLQMLLLLQAMFVFAIFIFYAINPFLWHTFKVTSFCYQKVEGRLFNAYFRPVGAFAGGEGNFWITESPKYFPIIEKEIYYDRTVLWNFNVTEYDGESVDQNEIVKLYIIEEVIQK